MKVVMIDPKGCLVPDGQGKRDILSQCKPDLLLAGCHLISVTDAQYALLRDGKGKMLPIGLVLETEASRGASKLAEAITDSLIGALEEAPGFNSQDRENLMAIIDARLADIRAYYEPEDLARCPIVSHHKSGSCAFCMTAAMRDLIILRTADA